ncbi:MAG: GNAT family N-acetyltransferase [Bacteroidetes bacterium]|nr:MAG: GNAT family N-acetyltransferase [Bacteroidota bacterium]
MNLQNIIIRPIQPEDNAALATIIRSSLEEFGANHPGTVYFDPTTDNLSALFNRSDAFYVVAHYQHKVVGGAGIFPTEGLPSGVVELVKLYLIAEVRGIGLGKKLMEICMAWAAANGANKVYLETMPELKIAVPMYEKLGFLHLDGPMGNTGHFGCAIQMLKTLE